MARPLLQLADVTLAPSARPLFSNLSFNILPQARIALVGRNGVGKSSLLQMLAGLRKPDSGSVTYTPKLRIGYMAQDPVFKATQTLGDFAAEDLLPEDAHLALRFADGLKFDPTQAVETASGGQKRRAALARMLAGAPDLLLLDEPTNHLDIDAISWLESYLTQTTQAFVLISHDRRFLTQLSRQIIWLDRGTARLHPKGFSYFESWADAVWHEEDLARHKLDRKIKAEAKWAVEGISARRRRNQGRLHALENLRKKRAAMIARPETAALQLEEGPLSGRIVIEAENVSLRYEHPILQAFSAKIMRGDRVGIIGANGVGKTTLVKTLLKEITPDTGYIRHGTKLNLAIFDQNRAQLMPEATLWDSLTLDPETGVSGRSDQIMVRGQPRHIVGYLKEFLFDESVARAKVKTLSGGEKARLLLAKMMAKESNLMVLDEPTNDLDIETLDLFQDLLANYAGTVLLISHDRDFLDRIATTTIALEGNGRCGFYAGGWSDYQHQKKASSQAFSARSAQKAKQKNSKKDQKKPAPEHGSGNKTKGKLTFSQRHQLKKIPEEIEKFQLEIKRLEAFLMEPDIFSRAPEDAGKASKSIAVRQERINALEEKWLALSLQDEKDQLSE